VVSAFLRRHFSAGQLRTRYLAQFPIGLDQNDRSNFYDFREFQVAR
jgi:hypothetical protein